MKRIAPFLFALLALCAARAEWLEESTIRAAAEAFPARDAIGSAVLSGRAVSTLTQRGRLWIVALEPSGHIVMSGSDLANPIVGFSKNDFVEPDPKSPAFAVLEGASASVEALESKGGPRHARWDALLGTGTRGGLKRAAATPDPEKVIVEPFLDTHYNQCQPYNDYAPVHSATSDLGDAYRGRTPCGCVATATAQMLKHFQWPARIDKTLSYDHVFTDTNNVNHAYAIRFDGHVPFDWNSVGTEYDSSAMDLRGNVAESERYPIARLIHFCDVLAQMLFTPGSSGAFYDIVARNLLDWFTEGREIKIQDGADYSPAIEDLQAHIPLQVEIDSNGGGHQVVAHGWADDGDDKYIYLNFGWTGKEDGYYNLNGQGKVSLRKIHVGVHPRMMTQFDPLPKVSSEHVQLSWHIPEYWAGSGAITECSMIASAYDTSVTTKMSDDFSSDKGLSTSGLITRDAKTSTLDIYPKAWGTYTWNDLQLLTARSVLCFAIDSNLALGHELTVEASFDGGEWTVVSTPFLNLNAYSSGLQTYMVFLGDHGGEMARFRVRVTNNGPSYVVDFPIISIDDFCVTETCRQTEVERQNVDPTESGSFDFDGLTPGVRYAFTMEFTTEDGVVKSCPVFTTIAGEYSAPQPGEQSIDLQDLVYSAAAGDSAWSINGTNPTDTSVKTGNWEGGFSCSINGSLTGDSVFSFGWTASGYYGYNDGYGAWSYDTLVVRFTADDGTKTTLLNTTNKADVSSVQRVSIPLSRFVGHAGKIDASFIHSYGQYVGDPFGMTFSNPKVSKVSMPVLPEASFSVDTLEAGTIPEITSVSHTTSEVVDGLFSECSMGGNVFEVTCSPSVVSLEAHASAATLIPDSAINVTGLGGGRFIVEVDGAGIPKYAERTRTILTLAATDGNGSTVYKDLSLRFSTETAPDVYVPVEPGEYAVSVGDKGDIEETAVAYIVTAKKGETLTAADFVFGAVPKEAYDIVIAPGGESATVTLKAPVFGAEATEAEAEKDPDDPSGFLVVVDEKLDDLPHAEDETIGALPVKTFPGLYYQAGWGDDLEMFSYGPKVRAEGKTLYLSVIRQTGARGFYKLTVSEK